MKIEITIEKIKALTTKAYKGVSNNRLAPITSLMGLEFSPEGLTIRTFDGENHVVVRDASIKTEEPANITMNADMFKNLIDKLTTKESDLLKLLCTKMNELMPRDFALRAIWIDDNYFNARSMDVYITKLRKHLKEDPNVEILNVHGKGYKLVIADADKK